MFNTDNCSKEDGRESEEEEDNACHMPCETQCDQNEASDECDEYILDEQARIAEIYRVSEIQDDYKGECGWSRLASF